MTTKQESAQPIRYDAARAAAWRKWFHILEAGAQPLSDRMVALAGIGPGSRVLDIATGLGEPAVTAARQAAPDGHVLGVDLSPDMLAFARARAAEQELSNLEFREMDANALDLPAAAYDAVLSRWGLMFVPDLAGALPRIHACLAPGGRFVASVWGPPETAPAVGLGDRIVRAELGLAPPAEGAMTPFALSDVDAFARTVAAAGFSDVAGEWFDLEYQFDDAATFTQFRRERSGPLNKAIADVPEDRQNAAWDKVTEAAQAYAGPDGRVRVPNRAYCLSASV
jgi:SAM-dependent methyltransferase